MEDELQNIQQKLDTVRTETLAEIEGMSLVDMKAKLQEAYLAENEARRNFEGSDLNHEPEFQLISQRRAVLETEVHKIEPWTGEVSSL